jgi:exonuclease VII large subunit
MYNNINAETTEALDLLDLSIADVIEDFNKTKEKVEKKLEEKIREQQIFIEDTRNAKLRSALTEIISNRLNESKQALQEELEEATNYNDKDVLQEITYIQESLTTLEANIFKDIESVTINTNLEKWWPELLLPLPSNQILRSLSEMPSTKEHQINQILQQKGVHSLILKWIDFLRNNVYKC